MEVVLAVLFINIKILIDILSLTCIGFMFPHRILRVINYPVYYVFHIV